MTPHQSNRSATIVGGIFGVASFILLMLLARDYHTLLLILIGVMFALGAITFAYDRSATLWGFGFVAAIGFFSLVKQGYQTLSLVTAGVIFGTSALLFICYDCQHPWHWWFPDQPFNPTVKRWLRYLLQLITAGFAYAHARFYINFLTGVDPGNFPAALAALTILNTLFWWMLILPFIMLVMTAVYMGVAYIAGLRGAIGTAEIGGISGERWGFRGWGAISTVLIVLMLTGTQVEHPWPQRASRLIAAYVLVAAEFSYDRTCAVSSKDRLVARLKDFKEMKVSKVIIAESRGLLDEVKFSIGACEDQLP